MPLGIPRLFTAVALKRHCPAIVALVNELLAELLGSKGPVALAPRLRRFAFSAIARTVLGLDCVVTRGQKLEARAAGVDGHA